MKTSTLMWFAFLWLIFCVLNSECFPDTPKLEPINLNEAHEKMKIRKGARSTPGVTRVRRPRVYYAPGTPRSTDEPGYEDERQSHER